MRRLREMQRATCIAVAFCVAAATIVICSCDAGPADTSDGEWRVIGSSGEWVGTARFSDADEYGFAPNGLAAVQDAETELWGFVDKSGRWVVGPTFLRAREFAPNGLAPAQDDGTGLWGFVDETGSWAIEPRYADAWPFYDNGTAFVLDAKRERATWIDEKGRVLEGGRSPRPQAREDPATGLWGYVGWDGDWVVQPAFSDATRMGDNGHALARMP